MIEAFPSTYREDDGEIVPSYQPGNGNEPQYYGRPGEIDDHLEYSQLAEEPTQNIDTPAVTGEAPLSSDTDTTPVQESMQSFIDKTGRYDPRITEAIARSRARGGSSNSALGSVPRYIRNREDIAGGRF